MTALHAVDNNKWNIYSNVDLYINMVQYYLNRCDKRGQK